MQLISLLKQIETETKIKLTFLSQEPIKSGLERQVSYICQDFTSQKYWLAVAYTYAQKYRLMETVENITSKTLIWNKYFKFNSPITYGEFQDIYYVLYPYIEDTHRLDNTNIEKLFNIVEQLYANEKYKIKLASAAIDIILDSMLKERCHDEPDAVEIYKNSKEFIEYRKKT